MTQYICITGTDTGVGKTMSTAALTVILHQHGYQVAVIKPVQTGTCVESTDKESITYFLSGLSVTVHELYSYTQPLAPHHAAHYDDCSLPTAAQLLQGITAVGEGNDYVLIEGAGGALVELSYDNATIIDLAHTLSAATIVVTRLGLGTLNHTRLTQESILKRHVYLAGIIVGSIRVQQNIAEQENLRDFQSDKYGKYLGGLTEKLNCFSPKDFHDQVDKMLCWEKLYTALHTGL